MGPIAVSSTLELLDVGSVAIGLEKFEDPGDILNQLGGDSWVTLNCLWANLALLPSLERF